MSLQHAAQHLAAQGRGPDTTLVHMSKGEVKSLNDIAMAHGGQLTINPQTGLPEAGFLSSILPMVAGAALTGLTGGLINPMTAGLLVGGGTAALTGDIRKGLMAGLGAYGGAGIGSALATSGTQAAAQAATPSVSLAETAATTPAATPVAIPQTPITNSLTPTIPDPTQSMVVKPNVFNNYGYTPPQPGPNIMTGNMPIPANSPTANLRNFGDQAFEGIKSLGTEGGPTRFYENLGNVPGTYGPKTTLLAAAAPAISEAMEPGEPPPETPVDSDPGQQFDYMANPTTPMPANSPYGTEQKYFAPQYVKRTTPRFASGGVSDAGYNLGGYSDGGRLLRGPGDGVSDSIPAVIGRKQPARLADGEFVVPARIVSELGNGSTEAGARKLYAMMDRIQKARGKTVGKGKVAKNSRSEKYLPA
jgi:hypothetical protein